MECKHVCWYGFTDMNKNKGGAQLAKDIYSKKVLVYVFVALLALSLEHDSFGENAKKKRT